MSEAALTPTSVVPFSRLQKAIDKIKDLGLTLVQPETQPIVKIVAKIQDVDPDKVLIIARTLSQQAAFDTLVADRVASMDYGDRFNGITKGFDSILEDSKRMVAQVEKGKPGLGAMFGNMVMKVTRGDISDRFGTIEALYQGVAADVGKQVDMEDAILDAYMDFRFALKESQIASLDVLARMTAIREAAASTVKDAQASVAAAAADMAASDRAKLEMARDQAVVDLDREDGRFQIAKNLSDQLQVAYSVTEATMARLKQMHDIKSRLYEKLVTFFATNRSVLSALKATYTGMFGLVEATKTQEAMEQGIGRALDALADTSTSAMQGGLRAAYGSGIDPAPVLRLVTAIEDFERSKTADIAQLRLMATNDAETIRKGVEQSKQNIAALAALAA